jgi:hypothetical protein
MYSRLATGLDLVIGYTVTGTPVIVISYSK